jgi:hypothetical protein
MVLLPAAIRRMHQQNAPMELWLVRMIIETG